MSPLTNSPFRAGGEVLRSQDVATKLRALLPACYAAVRSARSTLNHLVNENERIQFVRFWQEYAKMASELEDKIRWLGGTLQVPKENASVKDVEINHEAVDARLLGEYEVVLKTPLPVDVEALLRRHVAKVKNMGLDAVGFC